MPKPMSNKQLLKRLAGDDFLSEVFILTAVESYAKQVLDSAPLEHGLINGDSWQQIAKDMLCAIDARK